MTPLPSPVPRGATLASLAADALPIITFVAGRHGSPRSVAASLLVGRLGRVT